MNEFEAGAALPSLPDGPSASTAVVGDPSCELFGLGWRPPGETVGYVGRHRADT